MSQFKKAHLTVIYMLMKNLVQFVGSTRERRQPAWFRSSEFDMC